MVAGRMSQLSIIYRGLFLLLATRCCPESLQVEETSKCSSFPSMQSWMSQLTFPGDALRAPAQCRALDTVLPLPRAVGMTLINRNIEYAELEGIDRDH